MNCLKCGAEFTPTPSAIKNYDMRCQSCRRDYNRVWREKRIAQGLPAYGSRVWDAEKKRIYLEKRKNDVDVKRRINERKRERAHNPEWKRKNAARCFLNYNKALGNIISEPCAFCGKTAVEAHHPDYDEPLLIVWLCSDCHKKIHPRQLKHPELYYKGKTT